VDQTYFRLILRAKAMEKLLEGDGLVVAGILGAVVGQE